MCTDNRQQVDVPLILARPVSNLLDCPPFKFESDPLLSPDTRHQFDQHWQAARESSEAPDLTDELVPELRERSQSASREQAMDELHRAGHRSAACWVRFTCWDSCR